MPDSIQAAVWEVLDRSEDILLMVWSREHVLLYLNQAARLRHPADFVVGRSLREMLGEGRTHDFLALNTLLTEAFASGLPGQFEAEFPQPDSEATMWLSVRYFPSQGRLVSISTDITERVAAEREAQRVRDQFELAMRRNPVPSAITTMSGGVIKFANPAMCRQLGWDQKIVGRTTTDIGLWVDAAQRVRMIETMSRQGHVDELITHFRRKDGTVIEGIFSSETLEFDGEPCVLGMFQDITHRVRAEQASKASEARLLAFLNSLPAPAHIRDAEGNFLTVNQAFADSLGSPPEAIVGRRDRDLLSAGLITASIAADSARLVTGEAELEDFKFQPDPSQPARWFHTVRFPIAAADGADEVGLIATDVTERRALLEQVTKTSQSLALLLSSTAEGMFGVDRGGRCTFVNRAAVEMLGLPAEQLEGSLIHNVIHHRRADGSPYPWEQCPMFGAMVSGTGVRVENEVFWRPDGSSFPAEFSAHPLTVDGLVQGTVVAFQDISARRQRDAELEGARQQALAGSRAKSEFLATMSHEIRTPMNGVIGMTDLLLTTPLDEKQREYAQVVRSSGRALLAIIDDILDFSKIEQGQLQLESIDFDLVGVVEEVGELLAAAAHDKGLELILDLPADLPSGLRGDPGRLRQVLLNLVGNAIKFTDHGQVVIHCRSTSEQHGAAHLQFEVRDTGIGMSPEVQESLFERFVQADSSTTRRFGGTGLGLAIAQRLVAMMAGQITVDSAPSRGSTFTFTLVLQKGAAVAAALPGALLNRRVLLVDDTPTNLTVLAGQVAALGMQTVSASSGAQALDLATAAQVRHEPFDLVLTDHHMPDLDGFGLALALATNLVPRPPVIVLSSGGARDQGSWQKDPNIAGFLSKPVRRSHLLAAITRVMSDAQPPVSDDAVLQDTQLLTPAVEGRVLVADDNPMNQRFLTMLLEKAGFEVDVVGDGLAVLKAVAAGAYDMILMDCEMPLLDGYGAATVLREREGGMTRVPILAVTASAMTGDAERALAAGMDGHITKPIDADELFLLLRHFIPAPPGVPAKSATAVAVDAAALQKLAALDGTGALYRSLVELLTVDGRASIDDLERAARDGDLHAARKSAHSLLSAASVFGNSTLVEQAREAEHLAIEGLHLTPIRRGDLLLCLTSTIYRLLTNEALNRPPG